MKKLKLKRFGVVTRAAITALVLAITPLTGVGLEMASAASQTAVWTGAGDGETFSDTANWQSGSAPQAGDILSFPTFPETTNSGSSNEQYLTNDLNLAWGGLTLGTASDSDYTIYNFVDPLQFASGATITDLNANGMTAYFEGGLTANGDLTLKSISPFQPLTINNGTLTIDSAHYDIANLGGSPQGIVLTGTSPKLSDDSPASASISLSAPITVSSSTASLEFGPYATGTCNMSGGTCTVHDTTYSISSPISLSANTPVTVYDQTTVNFTGAVTGGHQLTRSPTSAPTGVLNVGGTSLTQQPTTTNWTDNQQGQDETINDQETAVLDGTRQFVYVSPGGILKGTGTAAGISVAEGGTVAPGHSPGTLTVKEDLDIEGTYQAELKDTTAGDYDQIVINSGSVASPQVTLGADATLDLRLYSGYNIKTGDKFTIVDNQSGDPVSGTFKGLAEGAHITVGNVTFSISYVGGNGNDIVLTALNSGVAPAAPDTAAFQFVKQNPAIVAVLGIVSAAAVAFVLKRRTR